MDDEPDDATCYQRLSDLNAEGVDDAQQQHGQTQVDDGVAHLSRHP